MTDNSKTKTALLACHFQLLYYCRPHCKARDKMMLKFGDNLIDAGIKRDSKLWMNFMCRWIAAASCPHRIPDLIHPCIDAIEYLIEANR